VKNLTKRASSHEDRFSKTLFTLSRCRIAENDGSGDLLSRLQIHIDERDEIVLAAQQRMRQRPRCVGGSWFGVTTSMAATHIYREDMPRVTASRNRLALSLSKLIRHGLIAKLNGKRQKEAADLRVFGPDFDGLFMCTSYAHAHRLASSCHDTPRPAPRQPGEASVCVFLHFFSPSHTYKCIESNPPYNYTSLHLH
jgi:hypothetical protein